MSIHVAQLSKEYKRPGQPPQRAVDNVSFRADAGEIVGFLGPNGAGKSTTMRIATGYLPPTAGTVHVAGHDVRHAPDAVRRSIGYLPEHNPLYLDLYVREYLQFSGRLHGMGKTLRQDVARVIERVGLGREQHKKIGQLSKGYRQRVGLAQALLHNPPVLILDEPTTGLDPNQVEEIRQVIRDAGREKTVLFSTHILPEAEALCDRLVVINQGCIVANGTLAELRQHVAQTVSVVAEFEQPLPDATLLKAVPGVLRVEMLQGNNVAGGRYVVEAQPGTELRPVLFRLAADHGLALIGLRAQEQSLEALFRELTSGKESERR